MKSRSQASRTLLVAGLAALLTLAFSIIYSGCITEGSRQPESASRSLRAGEARQPTAATPGVPSNTTGDPGLSHRIEDAIKSSDLGQARWGICVIRVRDGQVVYARDADYAFAPASNMKLFSTAVALDLLGEDYRWRTSVYSASKPDKAGVIDGDVILYGRGAPDLDSKGLAKLADEVQRLGVRRIKGAVVGDESFFRGEALGDGWTWNDVQWYFGAEVSALTIDGNEVRLTATPAPRVGQPAAIRIEPATDYVRLINQTSTVDRNDPATIGLTRGLSDNVIRVWGDFPIGSRGLNARLAVHQPAHWAARIFREQLVARGIVVEGETDVRNARGVRDDQRLDPTQFVDLASLTSRMLLDVVRETNKKSLNLEAELILRTLGKEKGRSAPDPDPRKMIMRDDDKAALAVIRKWLEDAGVTTDQLALHDGSGLSRLNMVTPRATAQLLSVMTRKSAALAFRDSLPNAGRDGTLVGRLRTATDRIQAKTGLLAYVDALSGYVTTSDGELLAFSIICNNETGSAKSVPVIDTIALLLTQPR